MHHRFLSLLLFAAPLTIAAATPPRCASITEPAPRLACYDALWPPAAPVATATPASTASTGFGFTPEQARARSTSDATPEAQRVLQATVSSLRQRATGEFVATMDNGQVWVQAEVNSKARLQPGNVVTIRRGVLGYYLLVTPGGIGTRVRRIE